MREPEVVPNTEFGHLEIDGHDAEKRAAASVKDTEGLSYPQWAKRVHRYLSVLEDLIWPDLFIVGGGVSKKAEKWVPLLDIRTPVIVASLQNNAGIVGAVGEAAEGSNHSLRPPPPGRRVIAARRTTRASLQWNTAHGCGGQNRRPRRVPRM